MKPVTALTLKEIREMLNKKEISSLEVTKEYIDRINKKNNSINAFITVNEEDALECAKLADTNSGKGMLSGIPYALKDNICTKDIATTCASKILSDFVPAYDATVVEKLKAQCCPILGKLNMDEFAMGSSNENSAFGAVKNPINTDFVSGGSSGGSAAAVCADMTPFALGSDTGGSVRLPASFCGVVGLKPTYGAVSRYGLVAFASSFDQIGVITKNVYDNTMVFLSIMGQDNKDSTSLPQSKSFDLPLIESGVKGLRIAVYIDSKTDTDVKESVMCAAKVFENLGAEVCLINFASLEYAVPAYYLISSAEASSNLARYDGIRYGKATKNFSELDEMYVNTRTEGFGDEVKRRIMLGTFALSSGYCDEYYKKAVNTKELITKEFSNIFETFDIILTPTSPSTAFRFGEKAKPIDNYLCDLYTVPANLTGLPAISMPCGRSAKNGMSIGVQLIGKAFDETTLFKAGYALEQIISEDNR